MGGLFSAPKPEPAAAAASSAAAGTASGATSTGDAGRDARVQAVERARRGLAGTVVTGDRGVLDPLPPFATRKTLLGE